MELVTKIPKSTPGKYVCFNFPEGKQLGTAPTANVCEGHQEEIKTGECVMVNREGKEV